MTYDARVKLSGYTSKHLWTTASGVKPLWDARPATGQKMPAIAIVDSGIDKNRADFDMGARVIDDVVITRLEPNSQGDGRGHGTFVAGIAAGSATDQAGAAPQANLISLDVMDDSGMARTSDVIAAAEWIYQNRASKNIKVANFSLHSTMPSNFVNDPLDKAVEKLWFGGVTVVAAAGNYGKEDGPSGVPYAPGNDPFVITVGAVDLEGSVNVWNHDVPNWSAYGYTKDGFRKPELAAAGRYMIGPVPTGGDAPHGEAGQRRERRVHAPVRHVVLGSGGGRRRGAAPHAASDVDAGSDQGCADAARSVHPGCALRLRRRGRDQRLQVDAPQQPSEPERGTEQVPQARILLTGMTEFDGYRLVRGGEGERLLGLGLLERRLLVGRVLDGRLLEQMSPGAMCPGRTCPGATFSQRPT